MLKEIIIWTLVLEFTTKFLFSPIWFCLLSVVRLGFKTTHSFYKKIVGVFFIFLMVGDLKRKRTADGGRLVKQEFKV